MSTEDPLVLIVEDEPDLAELYATWLSDDYRTRTAYGGREALESLDQDVDVILLDRRMPDLSGDDVLEAIHDRNIGAAVAMVTAVEPDFDIVEMGFDDYLVKPVSKETLHETVSNLLLRTEYTQGVQELFALASKKAVLESEKGPTVLEESEEYQRLSREVQELRAELDTTLEELSREQGEQSLYQAFSMDGDFDESDDDGDDR